MVTEAHNLSLTSVGAVLSYCELLHVVNVVHTRLDVAVGAVLSYCALVHAV